MKGAVRTIAAACRLSVPATEALEARVSGPAAKGYRALAVAHGPETGATTMVGLVLLYDPPRPDARQLIAALQDHGVAVKMLTGDELAIASEIARGVGLSGIRHMADLKVASTQPGSKTADVFVGAGGFAEVFPEDKYLVVKELQSAGHVTGMTGITLAADHVRPSKKPETWQVGGFVLVSVVLGFMMLAEAFLALWLGRSYFGLANSQQALYTFSFLLLLYFNVFSVISTRERRWFWSTRPSRILMAALAANALVSTGLTFVGFPGLERLPWRQALAIFSM